ncbi:hypothetical protein AB2M62_16965 [Sphingomonas sp. MMS12-HWE2-04]|uniref:hypothetical protein n=1 Tax=Sphingomonas sp. MMS12-HWE2-04 TaxID=3234199 RepID=UPI0038514012
MLLFFILAMLFILHAQFLIRNLLFNTYEANFFQFTQSYLFDRHIAALSLLFTVLCAAAFAMSYGRAYAIRSTDADRPPVSDYSIRMIMRVGSLFAIIQIIANFTLAFYSDFQYQTMAETLESSAFVFELRAVFLLCLSFLTLNVPPKVLFTSPQFRLLQIILVAYALSIIVVQSRSRVFEFATIPVFAYLMWTQDRIRLQYIAVLLVALVAPNVIVLGRLGIPDDTELLINGLFSIEYSVTLNNFLGGAIEHRYILQESFTFLNSLWLVIPSPIRTLIGIDVVKSDAYDALVHIADVRNGGYSMLAEMFQNFDWWAIMAFALFGWIIGALNRSARRVGSVGIFSAMAPMIYVAFVVALRNDFGVLLKFIAQLMVVASFLRIFIRFTSPAAPSPSGLVVGSSA